MITFELPGVFFVEDCEVNAVEPDQSFFSCEPNITILALQDRVDGVLWKPGLRLPHLLPIPADLLLRVQCQQLETAHQVD